MADRKPVVVIVGASGTVGLSLAERLARTDEVTVVAVNTSTSAEDYDRALSQADVAVLCLPPDAAQAFVERAPAGLRILDASSAHRVSPGWVYGLPELDGDQPQRIRDASRVANPGCYATGAILLLRPIMAALHPGVQLQVAITAVGGASSGGRGMLRQHEQCEVGYRLYGLTGDHRHLPEIQQYANLATEPVFMPAVGGYERGTLVQIPFVRAHLQLSYAEVVAALQQAYANTPRVRVEGLVDGQRFLSGDDLAGQDDVRLMVLTDEAQRRFVLVAQFDNLGKGAAGAAEQNLRLMLGLD